MAYVYGASRKRPPVVAPAPPSAESVEEPAPQRGRNGAIPGRKRGKGKNNKHGTGCGSRNGWMAHKRAGEDPCEPCNVANRIYKNACARAARVRKREAAA